MRKTLIGMAFCAMLLVLTSSAQSGQKEFQKLTVGYTPIGAGSLPLFVTVEERTFQKYGYEVFPVFMGGSPEIKSVSDVRGKRIGVTRFGSSTYFAALSMLESAGIKPNEVVFIQNGGLGESFAALQGGRVDVTMIGYPFSLYARNAGFHLLFR